MNVNSFNKANPAVQKVDISSSSIKSGLQKKRHVVVAGVALAIIASLALYYGVFAQGISAKSSAKVEMEAEIARLKTVFKDAIFTGLDSCTDRCCSITYVTPGSDTGRGFRFRGDSDCLSGLN